MIPESFHIEYYEGTDLQFDVSIDDDGPFDFTDTTFVARIKSISGVLLNLTVTVVEPGKVSISATPVQMNAFEPEGYAWQRLSSQPKYLWDFKLVKQGTTTPILAGVVRVYKAAT